jgi:hypothetical protein
MIAGSAGAFVVVELEASTVSFDMRAERVLHFLGGLVPLLAPGASLYVYANGPDGHACDLHWFFRAKKPRNLKPIS